MNTKLIKLPLITAAGGAGTSTGTARAGVPNGQLLAVAVDYASAPATTDVVLTCTHPLTKTLLTLSNVSTDLPLTNVTELEKDTAGADRATPATRHQYVGGELVVDVAQADSGTTVQVWALVEVAA